MQNVVIIIVCAALDLCWLNIYIYNPGPAPGQGQSVIIAIGYAENILINSCGRRSLAACIIYLCNIDGIYVCMRVPV